MELKSQQMRKLAPELDPLRIGTGWKPEDLSKPQVMMATAIREADICIFWWRKCAKASRRLADMGPVITVPISVTVRARGRTASITVW